MESTEIAERLFAALAGKDDQAVRSLCSPRLRVQLIELAETCGVPPPSFTN